MYFENYIFIIGIDNFAVQLTVSYVNGILYCILVTLT